MGAPLTAVVHEQQSPRAALAGPHAYYDTLRAQFDDVAVQADGLTRSKVLYQYSLRNRAEDSNASGPEGVARDYTANFQFDPAVSEDFTRMVIPPNTSGIRIGDCLDLPIPVSSLLGPQVGSTPRVSQVLVTWDHWWGPEWANWAANVTPIVRYKTWQLSSPTSNSVLTWEVRSEFASAADDGTQVCNFSNRQYDYQRDVYGLGRSQGTGVEGAMTNTGQDVEPRVDDGTYSIPGGTWSRYWIRFEFLQEPATSVPLPLVPASGGTYQAAGDIVPVAWSRISTWVAHEQSAVVQIHDRLAYNTAMSYQAYGVTFNPASLAAGYTHGFWKSLYFEFDTSSGRRSANQPGLFMRTRNVLVLDVSGMTTAQIVALMAPPQPNGPEAGRLAWVGQAVSVTDSAAGGLA